MGKIIAVCTSEKKGTRKKNIGTGTMIENFGLEGDAHGGEWHRQISLLAIESIQKMQEKGLDVVPGDFAENLTTEGIELQTLPLGTKLRIGEKGLGEVTQIGKICHNKCAVYYQAGDCIMPKEGIFIKVLKGGIVQVGDEIEVLSQVIKVGVITASDKGSRAEREDLSGPALKELVRDIQGEVVEYVILPDDQKILADKMCSWSDDLELDLILTTGGTGFSQRDITPEATLAVAERLVPGIAEVMRAQSLKVTSKSMLSRAVAVLRKRTLIINLPGSPKAVRECWAAIAPALPHGIQILKGEAHDCAGDLPEREQTE